MRYPLLLLLPLVLAATRSIALGTRSSGMAGARRIIPVETEYQILLIVVFCLTGLLVSLCLMIRFPEIGAIIAETDQF